MLSNTLVVAVCLAGLPSADAGESTTNPSESQVTVEIFELDDKQTWPSATDVASEAFEVTAMAVPFLPRRYSAQGLIVDRQPQFVVRVSAHVFFAAGQHDLLMRAMNRARLLVDGKQVAATQFKLKYSDGHNVVPKLQKIAANIRTAAPGHAEQLVSFSTPGRQHRIVIEAVVGGKKKRAEIGELSVSSRNAESESQAFQVLATIEKHRFSLTDENWNSYVADQQMAIHKTNFERRTNADKQEKTYWQQRHTIARRYVSDHEPSNQPNPQASQENLIDSLVGIPPNTGDVVDDFSFVRRLALDTVGVVPTLDELNQYMADGPDARRQRAIDRYLNDDRWADHWVSYWQDVLAENPGILKPKLNNTGPFRWWVHESFLDNKPMDRFVTELIMMRGSKYAGGPAGFALATQNDVPMAAKAHVICQAFLGIQMKCARCHDAPHHDFKQEQLFNVAAMLGRKAQPVPLTSSIPTEGVDTDHLAVEVSLKPGSQVNPKWPFVELLGADFDHITKQLVRNPDDTREQLAAIITSPSNGRFAKVMVNRLWARYFGTGIVDSVDDWEAATCHNARLLEALAREFVKNGYDLKHLARLIFTSNTYQSNIVVDDDAIPYGHKRRRLSAEQLVDSLFVLSNKELDSEALNLDVDAQRSVSTFLNLGVPRRAWEFTSLSNERDRPALSMPRAQSIVDVLATFGWRDSRQDPLTSRDADPTVQQPGVMANGVVVKRATCLSDDSALTALCLSATSPQQLANQLYLQVLSRWPDETELAQAAALLQPGFGDRLTEEPKVKKRPRPHAVSWSNHLNEEATRIKLELEQAVREGDPPTKRLRAPWRERAEDLVWAMVNSPEFVFVP